MSNKNIHNPWAGLSSYQDPENSKIHLKFCGRDNESYDVTDLIDNNIFVTLYGKSGTGKTSLLNAGVFPRLRDERYLPISVRLGMEARDVSFQKCVIARIEQEVTKTGFIADIDVVPLSEDEQAPEYLWSYFARKRFLNSDKQTLFPVLVLDQFEEVFRKRTSEAEVLLRQIYFMMDEGHSLSNRKLLDGSIYTYDYNFRFVVAIREDDLFRLEDSIDNNYLQNMKRCRYRLRNLSEEGAREAILIPGEELFVEEDKDKIADTIISISRNKADHSISANILSLICNRIFEKCQRDGVSRANLAVVETFVKGNPFEQFYKEATKGMSDREKAYLETHMVDSEGRRNSVAETDFLLHVRNGERLFEGESRILQRSSASSDGTSYRIELRHDSFCATIAALKEKRERRKRIRKMSALAVAAFAAIGITLFTLSQISKRQDAEHERQVAIREKSIIAQKNDSIAQKNDSIKAANIIIAQQRDSINSVNKELEETQKELRETKKKLEIEYDKQKRINKNQGEVISVFAKVTNTNVSNVNMEDSKQVSDFKATITSRLSALDTDVGRLPSKKTVADVLSSASQVNGFFKIKNNPDSLVNRVDDIVMESDGIQYKYESPTSEQINEWKKNYHDFCYDKVVELYAKDYNIPFIPVKMRENEPCLVYLILTSESLSDEKEKQSWFDLYSLMNQEQIDKLYDILYREHYKLAEIERKYQEKQAQIKKKYEELGNGSSQSNDAELQSLSAEELNKFAYQAARRQNWDMAIKAIDLAIKKEPEDANLYDSKGEILFDKGEEIEAVKMWEMVMARDSNFLDKNEGSTPLYEKLKKRGLISDPAAPNSSHSNQGKDSTDDDMMITLWKSDEELEKKAQGSEAGRDNMEENDDNVVEVDGIEYESAAPTTEQINEWKKNYHDLCYAKAKELSSCLLMINAGFEIPSEMMKKEPCLVYLILTSESLSDEKEKKNWFDLYSQANQEQINKLYEILYRNKYMHAVIEKTYQEKQSQIKKNMKK